MKLYKVRIIEVVHYDVEVYATGGQEAEALALVRHENAGDLPATVGDRQAWARTAPPLEPIDVSKATLQEAMDYAVRRIVEQGGRCGSGYDGGDFQCMYGDGNGRHCGVGWLLPEDDPVLMNSVVNIGGLVEQGHAGLPELVVENVRVMVDLQVFHDSHTREDREACRLQLSSNRGIDTSGPHWQAWIDMGEGDE